jgi:inner membrane protein
MSSFIGHSLAGLAAYAATQQWRTLRWHSQVNWGWLIWVLVIASIPDIDYFIPGLRIKPAQQILRTTHSVMGAILVPACTILLLWVLGHRGKLLKLKGLQAILAGLSHLLLDLMVGVFPLPLLYPFSLQAYKLPFGLLPSAGRIQLNNYLLYQNLLIELGVLLPLSFSLLLITKNAAMSIGRLCAIGLGFSISAYFMHWAFGLSR